MSLATPQTQEATLPLAVTLDAAQLSVSEINRFLHRDVPARGIGTVHIEHPNGMHNLAVGLHAPMDLHILGHAGYYACGMNKIAGVTVHGNVERGVAENMMSGTVRVAGNASECAGASSHGGLLIIEGNAAGRCGISLKGGDIVVAGNVGHMAMFMAQAGRLIVCGDAGPGLGDSLYEAIIYLGGKIEGLGADAREEPMTDIDRAAVADLLAKAGFIDSAPRSVARFRKITSARKLYHWNTANHDAY
jgi:methylamine---glutamate N-methyltransferase subunit B